MHRTAWTYVEKLIYSSITQALPTRLCSVRNRLSAWRSIERLARLPMFQVGPIFHTVSADIGSGGRWVYRDAGKGIVLVEGYMFVDDGSSGES